jgi:hypothetical protein
VGIKAKYSLLNIYLNFRIKVYGKSVSVSARGFVSGEKIVPKRKGYSSPK